MNHQIRLKSRPEGAPSAANFESFDAPMPSVGDGAVLRKTLFLSLDPYMRGRMSDAPSYAAPVEVGAPMCGHTVSEVIESRNPAFRKGDIVLGYDGWQQFGVSEGKELRTLDPSVPVSTALGVLGMRDGAVAAALRGVPAGAGPEVNRRDLRQLADVVEHVKNRVLHRKILDGELAAWQRLSQLVLPVIPRVFAPEIVGPQKAAVLEIGAQSCGFVLVEIGAARFGKHRERAA